MKLTYDEQKSIPMSHQQIMTYAPNCFSNTCFCKKNLSLNSAAMRLATNLLAVQCVSLMQNIPEMHCCSTSVLSLTMWLTCTALNPW